MDNSTISVADQYKMDNSTISVADQVQQWNREITQSLIPNNAILFFYMVAGLVGNCLVIFIYGFKMTGNKEDRYFIPFLAIADLLAALICSSFGIAQNMMQATFENDYLCKSWWFFAAFTTLTSVFILLIIAVHRYLKVCHPLGKQMSLQWKRFALCIGLAVAFILSVPMTYFYGSDFFLNEELNIQGFRCSRLSTVDKTGSLIFGGVLVLTAISIIISLICLYAKIGKTIRGHFKHSKIKLHHQSIEHSQNGVSYSDDALRDTSDTNSCQANSAGLSIIYSTSSAVVQSSNEIGGNIYPKLPSVKRRKRKRAVYRFTLMFMLITVIFLICYIPKVVIMLLEARITHFWEQYSRTGRSVVLFIYRIYIINNITNPIIYAFLDKKFAKEIKKSSKCCL